MARANHYPQAVDMSGRIIGRLTVMRLHPIRGGPNRRLRQWECRCECGTMVIVPGNALRRKHRPTRSCGCLVVEHIANVNLSHGDTGSTEYRAWQNMIRRCYEKSNNRYYLYGARGIRVCEEWRHSYETFLRDMGRKPSRQHSLDRRENDKHYSHDNCRWATRSEQAKNRRPFARRGWKTGIMGSVGHYVYAPSLVVPDRQG